MRGNGPSADDKPEDILRWIALTSLFNTFSGVPVVGSSLNSWYNNFGASLSPAVSAIDGVTRSVDAALKQLHDGKITLKEFRIIIVGLGTASGVPLSIQANRVLKAVEQDSNNVLDYLRGPKNNVIAPQY